MEITVKTRENRTNNYRQHRPLRGLDVVPSTAVGVRSNCGKDYFRKILGVMCVALCTTTAAACNDQYPSNSKEVVTKYFDYLEEGDANLMDSLFFKFSVLENNNEAWLTLIERTSNKVREDQLAWEVVCSKELSETAVVIVNQTMKNGKDHADPDTIFLVKVKSNWLLLPDTIAHNAKEEVRKAMSETQVSERHVLKRWAIGEIRGRTAECNQSR